MSRPATWLAVPVLVLLCLTSLPGCGSGRAEAPSDTAWSSQVDPEKSGWLVTDAGQSHIDDAARKGLPAVVKLGSDKCLPCREMNPVMADLARRYSGKVVFLVVDVYRNQDLASKYGVRVIPTIVFIDASGKAVASAEGYTSADEIMSFITRSGILK